MSFNLSEQEIKRRLIRLTNLEHLHTEAIRRNTRQAKQIKLLKRQVHLLQEQNKEKDKAIEKFSLQLEELRTKVFGKKKNKDKNDKPNGGGTKVVRLSSSYQRSIPEHIDREEIHTIDTCALCNTVLKKKRIRFFFVEDIPFNNPQKEAVKHMVEQGYCERCQKWISAIILPSAKCILGENIKKYIAYHSTILRLSNQQVGDHIRDMHQIGISQGEISKILRKEADRLKPEHEKLKVRIQSQKAQHYDETTWKVRSGIFGSYGWGMFGAENREAVFSLGKSKGKSENRRFSNLVASYASDE